MVEQVYNLDTIFSSLSNPTRRDILQQVRAGGKSIGQIAAHYQLSFAAVAKHLSVLERAGLVRKTPQGKAHIVTVQPQALAAADRFLEDYRQLWEQRLDALGVFLVDETKGQ